MEFNYFLLVTVLICSIVGVRNDVNRFRINVFNEVEPNDERNSSTLSLTTLHTFFNSILHNVVCKVKGSCVSQHNSASPCQKRIYIDIASLLAVVGGNTTDGIDISEFHATTSVVLHELTKRRHRCNTTLSFDSEDYDLNDTRNNLIESWTLDGKLVDEKLQSFLHTSVENKYSGQPRNHNGHQDDDIHSDEDGAQNEGTEHADDLDDHDEDHHIGDEAKNDYHEEHKLPNVVEEKCLAEDAVFYYLSGDNEYDISSAQDVDNVSAIIMYLMSQGAELKEKCRVLPEQGFFVSSLITSLNGSKNSETLSEEAFLRLFDLLGILSSSEETSNHDHDHDSDDHDSHDHDSHDHDSHDHDSHDHDSHDHKRRRSAPSVSSAMMSDAPNTESQADIESACYSPEDLRAVFEAPGPITPTQLTSMCPALLHQTLFGDCQRSGRHVEQQKSVPAKSWWYATVAVAIVCLCSALGGLTVPCISGGAYKVTMTLFVGLAVGTLCGDAILHLIPAALGSHVHDAELHMHSHGAIKLERYLKFSFVIMAGIYLFYLMELGFHIFFQSSNTTLVTNTDVRCLGIHQLDTTETNVGQISDVTNKDLINESEVKGRKTSSLSMMIILGDAVHNFADGLAIGAAFSIDVGPGVATSIAVFCHELPHELGDFAVLLRDGLTVKQALFWNLFSSSTAFVGLYLSLAFSTHPDVQLWIFAITAGMFLYISLVDLLPQMVAKDFHGNYLCLAFGNVGILFGMLIMTLIAVFEEHIVINEQ